jgi:hypothetical protein
MRIDYSVGQHVPVVLDGDQAGSAAVEDVLA